MNNYYIYIPITHPYMLNPYNVNMYTYNVPDLYNLNNFSTVSGVIQNSQTYTDIDFIGKQKCQEINISKNNEKRKKFYESGKGVMRNFLNNTLRRILTNMLKTDPITRKCYITKFKPVTIYNLNTIKMKSYISKTIKQLFEIDNDSNNLKIINEATKDNITFQSFINRKFDDVYMEYLESKEFDVDMSNLMVKKGKTYMEEYSIYVKNFLKFYKEKIPNKKKTY